MVSGQCHLHIHHKNLGNSKVNRRLKGVIVTNNPKLGNHNKFCLKVKRGILINISEYSSGYHIFNFIFKKERNNYTA